MQGLFQSFFSSHLLLRQNPPPIQLNSTLRNRLGMADNAPETLPNPFEDQNTLIADQNDASPLLASLTETIADQSDMRRPNFPMCFPIVYHNISQEIQPRYQSLVRFSLFACRSFGLVLFLTLVAQVFSDQIDSVYIFRWRELILSVFIFILCWSALAYGQYFPLYVCARDEKRNIGLIPFQFFTIFVMIFMFLGIPGTGMIGVWYTILSFQRGAVVNRLFAVTITALHVVNIIMQIALLILFGQLAKLPQRRE